MVELTESRLSLLLSTLVAKKTAGTCDAAVGSRWIGVGSHSDPRVEAVKSETQQGLFATCHRLVVFCDQLKAELFSGAYSILALVKDCYMPR